jgi:hypothetical protein
MAALQQALTAAAAQAAFSSGAGGGGGGGAFAEPLGAGFGGFGAAAQAPDSSAASLLDGAALDSHNPAVAGTFSLLDLDLDEAMEARQRLQQALHTPRPGSTSPAPKPAGLFANLGSWFGGGSAPTSPQPRPAPGMSPSPGGWGRADSRGKVQGGGQFGDFLGMGSAAAMASPARSAAGGGGPLMQSPGSSSYAPSGAPSPSPAATPLPYGGAGTLSPGMDQSAGAYAPLFSTGSLWGPGEGQQRWGLAGGAGWGGFGATAGAATSPRQQQLPQPQQHQAQGGPEDVASGSLDGADERAEQWARQMISSVVDEGLE